MGKKKRPRGLDADGVLRWFGWTVTPTQCWEWNGNKNKKGYGNLGFRGKTSVKAYRLAYETWVGPIPAGNGYHGTVVRHVCDNPACINPNHLTLGTVADNNADAINRGRAVQPRGEQSGQAKLTERDVLAIRSLHKDGTSVYQLARQFNMSETQLRRVVRSESWQHVQCHQ